LGGALRASRRAVRYIFCFLQSQKDAASIATANTGDLGCFDFTQITQMTQIKNQKNL